MLANTHVLVDNVIKYVKLVSYGKERRGFFFFLSLWPRQKIQQVTHWAIIFYTWTACKRHYSSPISVSLSLSKCFDSIFSQQERYDSFAADFILLIKLVLISLTNVRSKWAKCENRNCYFSFPNAVNNWKSVLHSAENKNTLSSVNNRTREQKLHCTILTETWLSWHDNQILIRSTPYQKVRNVVWVLHISCDFNHKTISLKNIFWISL